MEHMGVESETVTSLVKRGSVRIKFVANHLGVSKQTVYRLIQSGDLRTVRIRNEMRVLRASVDAYLAKSMIAIDAKPQ